MVLREDSDGHGQDPGAVSGREPGVSASLQTMVLTGYIRRNMDMKEYDYHDDPYFAS